jgi:hypothetical protein
MTDRLEEPERADATWSERLRAELVAAAERERDRAARRRPACDHLARRP